MKTTKEMIKEQEESIAVFYAPKGGRLKQCTFSRLKISLSNLMTWISGWGMRYSGRIFVGNIPRRFGEENPAVKRGTKNE